MTESVPILRQRNPSGRVTYYTPSRFGMQKLTRPTALSMISTGQAHWAGKPFDRHGGPGAPDLTDLIPAGELAALLDEIE